ncbi:MAG: ABC transporter permease [Desulfobacterales bacterium]|nr:ABC transporter permease [Desulfobacterales bacterium]
MADKSREEQRLFVLSVISPFIALSLWEVVVQSGLLDRRFFPPPTTVGRVLFELIRSGELFGHLSVSLGRIFLGFAMGAVPGILLGMIMGWSRIARALLDPIVSALFPIPKISLLPLFMILFGIGELSKVVTVAMGGFFLVLITTMKGVMGIDPVLIQAGRNYGAKGAMLFVKVILPASLPDIFTGLRLSLSISLLIIVAAEFVASDQGIGYFIWMSWSTLAVGKMYAGLAVIAILGILFSNGLELLGRFLMPWAGDRLR